MANTMHYLAVGLGLLYLMAGVFKVVPIEPGHSHMKGQFGKFAGVFPLKPFGVSPSADVYRCWIGVAEIGLGLLLAFGIHYYRVVSAIGLLVIMVIIVQSYLALGESVANLVIPIVCGGLLAFLLFSRGGFWGGFRSKAL